MLVAPLAEHGGDPLAGRLLGARAVGDDHLRGLDVERRLVRLLGREPDRARDPERARLEVGLGPHVEQSRIEPALDEPDHLRRHDPEAILPPALAPHPAVDADTHQRHAQRRQRPRERLRRRILREALGLLQLALDVDEVRHQLVGLGELRDRRPVAPVEDELDAGGPHGVEHAVAGLLDLRPLQEGGDVPRRDEEVEPLHGRARRR